MTSTRKAKGAQPTLRDKAYERGLEHNGIVCVCIAVLTCAALVGIFMFVTFLDFGGSADFIYNQF